MARAVSDAAIPLTVWKDIVVSKIVFKEGRKK
jgi:hypothetical protein